jgi:hypothetical protein
MGLQSHGPTQGKNNSCGFGAEIYMQNLLDYWLTHALPAILMWLKPNISSCVECQELDVSFGHR